MVEKTDLLKDYSEIRPKKVEDFIYTPLVFVGIGDTITEGDKKSCLFTVDDGNKTYQLSAQGVLYRCLQEVKMEIPFRAMIRKKASKTPGHNAYYYLASGKRDVVDGDDEVVR